MKILNWNRSKTNYCLNYTLSDFIHFCFINITFQLPMLSLTKKDERKVNVNNHSVSQKIQLSCNVFYILNKGEEKFYLGLKIKEGE